MDRILISKADCERTIDYYRTLDRIARNREIIDGLMMLGQVVLLGIALALTVALASQGG